jgi:dolichyl-phosphate-mannose-protein mannosyltransferase
MSWWLAKLNRPIVAIVAVGLLAGIPRFHDLAFPQRRIFDEYYYPKSACILLGYSNERCDINSATERFWRVDKWDTGAWVHPPLGKWAIALGELTFGTGSFGWRVSGAFAGTATVVLLAVIAQLLFGSALWTFVAGVLLAFENLSFVQSRTATLDVFVTFWIVLAFLLLLLDRRWIERRSRSPEDAGPDLHEPTASATHAASVLAPSAVEAPLWRPWRFASGVAIGAGLATKWSALAAVAGLIALSAGWEVARRRRAGVRRPLFDAAAAEGFGIVLTFLLVPAVVYLASYVGWFVHFGWSLGAWARLQGAMASYHEHLQKIDPATGQPVHPYLGDAWKWLLLLRPVLYYGRYVGDIRRVIYANGNPAIFWGSLLAIPYTAWAWWRDRDWRAGSIVVVIAAQYLPWFLISRPEFFFYVLPIVPFLVLADVFALRRLSAISFEGLRSFGGSRRVRPFVPLTVAFVVLAVGLFIWFYPTLTGGPLSPSAWLKRAWFPSWT